MEILCLQCAHFFEVKIKSDDDPEGKSLRFFYQCQECKELFPALHEGFAVDVPDSEKWLTFPNKYPRIIQCTHFEVKSKTH